MFLLLIACGAIYLLLGDRGEAAMLLGFVVVIICITFVRTQDRATLAALRDLPSPRALVFRDGEQRRIPGREVAQGDLLVLFEGDRVAADGVLLSGTNLATDESLLTGESVPVAKLPALVCQNECDRPAATNHRLSFPGRSSCKARAPPSARHGGAHCAR